MSHTSAALDHRSASEIMADARHLQHQHAPRVFGRAVRWLRDIVGQAGREPATSGRRHLTVH